MSPARFWQLILRAHRPSIELSLRLYYRIEPVFRALSLVLTALRWWWDEALDDAIHGILRVWEARFGIGLLFWA